MKRALRSKALTLCLLLAALVAAAGQQQDGRVARVQGEVPPNLKLMQDALAKRQNIQLAPGKLKDSNDAAIQLLTSLITRTKGLTALIDAGVTPDQPPLIEAEWIDIKTKMAAAGLTAQETGPTQIANQALAAGTAGSTTATQPTQPAQANALTTTAAAGTPGPMAAPLAKLPTIQTAYQIGVSRLKKGNGFQGGCTIGSHGITSDAPVWDVTITLLLQPADGFTRYGPFVQANDSGVILVSLISVQPNALPLLVSGRRAYIGSVEQDALAPKFHFSSLSLNEVTDLLQSLKSSDAKIRAAFDDAGPKITIYQVLTPTGTGQSPGTIFTSVEDTLLGNNVVNHENVAQALLANAGKATQITQGNMTVQINPPTTVNYSAPKLAGDTPDQLEKLASALANMGATGTVTSKPAASPSGKATSETTSQAADKPFVIENDCFQISFTPGLQNGSVVPAASFRGRISYLPDTVPLAFKLSALGDISNNQNTPRRISGASDLTYLSKPFWRGWYATFGATGNYSFSQISNVGVSEWRTGGKFELQTPVQPFLPVRSGNDQKPTFTVLGGAVGGSPQKQTTYIVRGDFVYSLQPSAKFFIDLQGSTGHSNDGHFNGRNDFSFGSFTGRYAVYNDWDFIAKYQCGRLDPTYIKSCGWQTGFGMRTK